MTRPGECSTLRHKPMPFTTLCTSRWRNGITSLFACLPPLAWERRFIMRSIKYETPPDEVNVSTSTAPINVRLVYRPRHQ